MFSNEKFSGELAVFWNKLSVVYPPSSYLKTFCELVRQIENDPELRVIINLENASMILQQLMVLVYSEYNVPYDLEDMRQTLRDAMYLWKSTILSDNLSRQRKCIPWLSRNRQGQ